MKWRSLWHRRSQAMPWGTWAILSPIELATAQPDCNTLREDKQIFLIKYMYMHIIRAKHPKISLFTRSITQKWDSTDLIWAHVVSVHCPHCRPTERSRRQPLVPPYSCSPLWTLWKVSGAELTSTTKYAWKSKIPNSAETRSHLFGGSPINYEGSWASFMPRFILTWLHWLRQGDAARQWCLWRLLGPAIWCLFREKSPFTWNQPSGRNNYHLLLLLQFIVDECCLCPSMWTSQQMTLQILHTSISWIGMQIWWFSPTANSAKWCKFELNYLTNYEDW